MKTVYLSAALVLLSTLSGCSFLYDLGQDRTADRCAQIANAADRSACLRANGESYENYEDKRKKAQQGKAPP